MSKSTAFCTLFVSWLQSSDSAMRESHERTDRHGRLNETEGRTHGEHAAGCKPGTQRSEWSRTILDRYGARSVTQQHW